MGLYSIYRLTIVAFTIICASPADGYMFQFLVECEYDDNIQNVVYLVKNVFNQQLNTIYDSRVQKYVGFGDFGMSNAAHYNSQAWKMAARKTEVQTICKYNAISFTETTLHRKVPPTVKVSLTKPSYFGELSIVECSVLGFYPREIKVHWLRNGLETTIDVSSTDTLANGDWSYQLHSYLEFKPIRGERVSCRVKHSSLEEALEMNWDGLEAKERKLMLGVGSFVIGLTVAFGGAVYYWWKKGQDFGLKTFCNDLFVW